MKQEEARDFQKASRQVSWFSSSNRNWIQNSTNTKKGSDLLHLRCFSRVFRRNKKEKWASELHSKDEIQPSIYQFSVPLMSNFFQNNRKKHVLCVVSKFPSSRLHCDIKGDLTATTYHTIQKENGMHSFVTNILDIHFTQVLLWVIKKI